MSLWRQQVQQVFDMKVKQAAAALVGGQVCYA